MSATAWFAMLRAAHRRASVALSRPRARCGVFRGRPKGRNRAAVSYWNPAAYSTQPCLRHGCSIPSLRGFGGKWRDQPLVSPKRMVRINYTDLNPLQPTADSRSRLRPFLELSGAHSLLRSNAASRMILRSVKPQSAGGIKRQPGFADLLCQPLPALCRTIPAAFCLSHMPHAHA